MKMQTTGIQSRPTNVKKLNQKVPCGRGKMKVSDAHSLSDVSVDSASNLITAGKRAKQSQRAEPVPKGKIAWTARENQTTPGKKICPI